MTDELAGLLACLPRELKSYVFPTTTRQCNKILSISEDLSWVVGAVMIYWIFEWELYHAYAMEIACLQCAHSNQFHP